LLRNLSRKINSFLSHQIQILIGLALWINDKDSKIGDFLEDSQHCIAGLPIDIANALLYLASDEARYISGHTLVVDAGQTTGAVPSWIEDDGAAVVAMLVTEHMVLGFPPELGGIGLVLQSRPEPVKPSPRQPQADVKRCHDVRFRFTFLPAFD